MQPHYCADRTVSFPVRRHRIHRKGSSPPQHRHDQELHHPVLEAEVHGRPISVFARIRAEAFFLGLYEPYFLAESLTRWWFLLEISLCFLVEISLWLLLERVFAFESLLWFLESLRFFRSLFWLLEPLFFESFK